MHSGLPAGENDDSCAVLGYKSLMMKLDAFASA